ncbi:MAG: adenine phosphoribosyltransferase [Clostridia bacterium]|nr:adenine phosphoribosyltransferase [Clostridia bacterium]
MANTLTERLRGSLVKSEDGKYDLLPVYANSELFNDIVSEIASGYEGKVDYVVAPEAMGWVLGAAVASRLGCGFAGVRKLENSIYMNQDICRVIFMDHEKQRRSFGVPLSWEAKEKRVLIVDDWIKTGSQIQALISLCERFDCTVAGMAVIGADDRALIEEWLKKGQLKCLDLEDD